MDRHESSEVTFLLFKTGSLRHSPLAAGLRSDKIVIDYLLLEVHAMTEHPNAPPRRREAGRHRGRPWSDLAAEQNPSDITTTAIAQRMGLTQGALFRHFPTKDAILQAAMAWVAERLLARVDKAAEEASSPLAALEAMFMTHIAFVSEHPGVPRMLFGELQRPGETLPKKSCRPLFDSTATGYADCSKLARQKANCMWSWTWRPPPSCSSAPSRGWSCSPCWRVM